MLSFWADNKVQAGACHLIVRANKRGDRFREIVRKSLEAAGLPQDLGPCKAYYDILRAADAQLIKEVQDGRWS